MNLNDVTIVCIDGVNAENGLKSLKYSVKDIKFAKSILISHEEPKNIPNNITFQKIQKLTHDTYSFFVLYELSNFIETKFCLITHDDGFIINPHLWSDDFLKYDYIGAPWGPEYGRYRVGNGGFSLRSKKLMNLCKNLPCSGHEDAACSIYGRPYLENNGCVFAPLEVAMKFALETKIPECEYNLNNTFGFHGRGVVESVHFGEGQQFKDRIKLLENI